MDLAKFREIISNAISNEEEAYLFYKSAAEKVADKSLRALFEGFARDEAGHKVLLEGYLTGAEKALQFDAAQDYKVAATVDKPKLSTAMKPADAIALAMKREEEAMISYTEFANLTTDADLKEAFLNLAKMEQGHKARLEEMYTNAAFPEVW